MTEDQFVEAVTQGQSIAPLYFAFAADANRRERALLDDQEAPAEVTIGEAVDLGRSGAVLLDTRAPESFASGHLRGSVNVGLDGRFAEYAGNVLRPGQQVVVLGHRGTATEAKVRLARIGFDEVVGAVSDVESALFDHPDLAEVAPRLTATEVASWLTDDPELQVVDVRNQGEVESEGSIPGARRAPLPQFLDVIDQLDSTRQTIVFCAGGYRSSVAASTLRAHGFAQVADLIGGHDAWVAATGGTAAAHPVA